MKNGMKNKNVVGEKKKMEYFIYEKGKSILYFIYYIPIVFDIFIFLFMFGTRTTAK